MIIDDRAILLHRELEQIAIATLRVAGALMETGARAQVVHRCSELVADGLGAEGHDLRIGYGSISITVSSGVNTITRMVEIGDKGVNQQLDHAIRTLAKRIEAQGSTPQATLAELERLQRETPHHSAWIVALAVGVACAAVGRLFGVDWPAFAPVVVAGAIGQALRRFLLLRGYNVFVVAAAVAFASALIGGVGARLANSRTVDLAMIASVLLLVPGIPCINALYDIMEGRPTLGAARSVTVAMLMVFIALGVWMAQSLLGLRP